MTFTIEYCTCNKFTSCDDCLAHDTAICNAVLDVVKRLYDAGFKDPLVTVECAIKYIENPTIPGYPEKQVLNKAERNNIKILDRHY